MLDTSTQPASPAPSRGRVSGASARRIHRHRGIGEEDRARGRPGKRFSALIVRTAWIVASALPLVGLVSRFLRRHLDPAWVTPRLHFSLFFLVGSGAMGLAYFAGQAADRRGDARVFLLSLAFLATGGFLAVHAIGTPGILLNNEIPGFEVAIPAGMTIGAVFACASAFIDVRLGAARAVVRHRNVLRRAVFAAIAVWSLVSLAQLPPLAGNSPEGGVAFLRIPAAIGAAVYFASAIRYVVASPEEVSVIGHRDHWSPGRAGLAVSGH
jgi:hypothetical protein